MCGLFGFSRYANSNIKGLSALTRSLAEESTVRGTDAAGIAYCHSGNLRIVKEDGSQCLVPYVKAFVKDVQLAENKIIIKVIEGLL